MNRIAPEARLAQIEQRIAALEERLAADPTLVPTSSGPPSSDAYWAVNGVRDRYNGAGGVLYTGVAHLPSGDHAEWQRSASVESLLDGDWTLAAERLAALAHPVRLQLIRAVLEGCQATAELAALDGMGSTGQIHHHLRQLIVAGWLRSSGRGRYEVPTPSIIPLLAVVTASTP